MKKPFCVTALAAFLAIVLAGCSGAPSSGSRPAPASQMPDMSEAQSSRPAQPGDYAPITVEHSIGDIVAHPAFGDFGEKLLPWVGERNDYALPLSQAASLMPYHGNVSPEVMAAALNELVDDAAAGQTIYYDYYSEEERQADPAKADTGLFFLRGAPGAPFAVICPGGGWSYVGSLHEGFPYAMEVRDAGYNAFVIKYRTGGGQPAAEDLAAALSFIFENAGELQVDTEGYSLWGSSAGARMAATIGSHGTAAFGGDDLPGPGAVIMLYTSHTDLAETEPPTFAAISDNDPIASPSTMRQRIDAIAAMGVDTQFELYQGAGHGFGLGTGTDAEGWMELALAFWARQIE